MTDLLGPFSTSESGNKYIIVIICILTGFSVIRPLYNKSADEVLKIFDSVFALYGLPLSISSDNGKEFKNAKISECPRETFW